MMESLEDAGHNFRGKLCVGLGNTGHNFREKIMCIFSNISHESIRYCTSIIKKDFMKFLQKDIYDHVHK